MARETGESRTRGKKTGRKLEINPAENPGEAPPEAGGPEAVSLFDASGDSRVRIMRQDDKTLKYIFHGYLPPHASEQHVSDAFGGGKYRTQLIIVNDKGFEVIKTQRDINVPGAYKPPMGQLPGVGQDKVTIGTSVPSAISIPSGSGGNMVEVLNSALVGSVIELLKSFREIKTPPVQSSMTPEVLVAMINKQSEMQMEVMKALFNQNKGDSKKELLELMTEIKGLIGPTGGAPNPNNPAEIMGNIVDTIKQLRDLTDDINPKTSAEPMDILGKLTEVIVSEQQQRVARRGPARTPAEKQQQNLAVVKGGQVTPRMPVWQQILRKEGPKLLSQAQAGRDPGLVANVALEYAPAPIQQHLAGFFQQEPADIIKKMNENIPGLEEYAEWTAGFVQEARIALGYEEEPEESPEDEDTKATEGTEGAGG